MGRAHVLVVDDDLEIRSMLRRVLLAEQAVLRVTLDRIALLVEQQMRLAELERLLPKLDQRYPKLSFIDLRFDRRIIFQPAL